VRTVLMLYAAVATLAAQSLPPALADLFNRAVEAEKSGRFEAAEKAYLEVLKGGGRLPFVYNNLGTVYQLRGNHERALIQFKEALRLDPDYSAPRILMGGSLLALGRTAEAVTELERAVKMSPAELRARVELARAYERAGNRAGVVDQFSELRQLAPQDPEYAYQLGRAYMKLGTWCFEQIMRVAPDSARVHLTLAENLMVQGRAAEAIEAYRKAALAEPKLAGVHLALAQIYLKQGQLEDARREISNELGIVPESAAALAFKQRLDRSLVQQP
jgi:Flp pilus assembly protein TadD